MKEVTKKICADKNCSNEFTPFNTIQKYCSSQCQFKNKKPNLKLKPLYTPPKPKKCLECGEKFVPKNVSTEKVCSNYDCRVEYALKIVEKNKVSNEKLEKRKKAEEKNLLKEKLKTLSEWKKEFQIIINSIVRAIDKGHPCIATNSYEGKVNAGHYIGTLANPTIRFHLENIWLQSEHSNTWKSGDTLRYQQGIIDLYGKDYLDYMNNLQSIPPIKLSIEDIKEKIPIAREILKWIKLQDRKFSLEERIELRKTFNKEIGIYK